MGEAIDNTLMIAELDLEQSPHLPAKQCDCLSFECDRFSVNHKWRFEPLGASGIPQRYSSRVWYEVCNLMSCHYDVNELEYRRIWEELAKKDAKSEAEALSEANITYTNEANSKAELGEEGSTGLAEPYKGEPPSTEKLSEQIHIFSSFFYKKLTTRDRYGPGYDKSVERILTKILEGKLILTHTKPSRNGRQNLTYSPKNSSCCPLTKSK